MSNFWLDDGYSEALRPDLRTKAREHQPRHHALNFGTHMQLWSLSCQHLCNQHPLASQEGGKKNNLPYAWIFSAKMPCGGYMNQIVFFPQLNFEYNLLVVLLIHVIKELLRLSHKSKKFFHVFLRCSLGI